MHGVKNTGDGPLSYYMVKWTSKGVPSPAKPADAKEEEALARIRALGGRDPRLTSPGTPVVKIDFKERRSR